MEQADRDSLDLFDIINLFQVPVEVWFKMQELAAESDIDKGGIYDKGIGAINVWASPEDKPKDYVHPMKSRISRSGHTRVFIATIRTRPSLLILTLTDPSEAVKVRSVKLCADFGASEPANERRNALFEKYTQNRISRRLYEMAVKHSLVSEPECEWIRQKSAELREMAETIIENHSSGRSKYR